MEETNVKDEIIQGRAVTKEVINEVSEKIEKERKERLVSEMTDVVKDSQFERKYSLLKLQYRRDAENVAKDELKKKSALDDSLAAGNVKTPEDYNKTKSEIEKESQEAYKKLKEEYQEQLSQLRKLYPWHYTDWSEFVRG